MTTTRWTTVGAVTAAIALLLFPILRPWPDETVASNALATAFASDRWVVAHLCGILGLGLLAPTFLGLRSLLGSPVRGTTTAAVILGRRRAVRPLLRRRDLRCPHDRPGHATDR